VTQCAPPDPTAVCERFDVASGAVRCGEPYLQVSVLVVSGVCCADKHAPTLCHDLQGSWLCGACAQRHFALGDGTCQRCPTVDSVWARFGPLIYIVCAILGVVLIVWGALLLVVRLFGGTLAGGASRMVSLFIWAITTVQVRRSESACGIYALLSMP
jgi:hypothetical protein